MKGQEGGREERGLGQGDLGILGILGEEKLVLMVDLILIFKNILKNHERNDIFK